MPRNAAGVYSLPDPPRVPNTVIDSPDENVTRDDIATELTNSLDRNGRGGMLAPFRIADGTIAAPGLAFLNEPGSGLWRAANGDIRIAVQGADYMKFAAAGVQIGAVGKNGVLTLARASDSGVVSVFKTDGIDTILDAEGGGSILLQNAAVTVMSVQGTGVFMANGKPFVTSGVGGQIIASAAAVPGFAFNGDTDTGLAWQGSGIFDLFSDGAAIVRIDNNQISTAIGKTLTIQGPMRTGNNFISSTGVNQGLVFNGANIGILTQGAGSGSAGNNGFWAVNRASDGATAGNFMFDGANVMVRDDVAAGIILRSNGKNLVVVGPNQTLIDSTLSADGTICVMRCGSLGGDIRGVFSVAGGRARFFISAQDGLGNGVPLSLGGALEQVRVLQTAGADRFLTLTGAAGANPTIGTSAGNLLLAPTAEVISSVTMNIINAGPKLVFAKTTGVTQQFRVQTDILVNDDFGIYDATAAVARLTVRPAGALLGTNGFAKFSQTAGFNNPAGTFHEMYSNAAANPICIFTNINANPQGLNCNYPTDPNDTAHEFFGCYANGGYKHRMQSNGGYANFQANDINLSDAEMKRYWEPYTYAQLEALSQSVDAFDYGRFKFINQSHDDWNHGYLAQDVRDAFADTAPELIEDWPTRNDEKSVNLLSVYTHDFVNISLAVARHEIRKLRAEVDHLKGLLNA